MVGCRMTHNERAEVHRFECDVPRDQLRTRAGRSAPRVGPIGNADQAFAVGGEFLSPMSYKAASPRRLNKAVLDIMSIGISGANAARQRTAVALRVAGFDKTSHVRARVRTGDEFAM